MATLKITDRATLVSKAKAIEQIKTAISLGKKGIVVF